jgi:ATP-binding cassette, subfamily B, multidrug efflux pump
VSHYLWELRPYGRQVAGQLVLGSLCGIVMNTAVVLPPLLLGQAIDAALALSRGETDAAAVTWAALLFVGGTLLTEVPRLFKRWWLMTGNARIRANLRADAFRGVLAWPMERLQRTPVGDVMARIVGDVEVLGVGVREFTIEIWDTVLFSISLIVAMLVIDPELTVLVLLPVPIAMVVAHATGRWVTQRTTAAREANADLTAALQEQLSGVRVLRLFARADAAVEQVARLAAQQADRNLAVSRLRGSLQPLYTTLMSAGIVFLVWQGSERVISGALTVGAFVAYLTLFLRFVNRGFRVPQLVNAVQSGGAAYVRLRPLLAAPAPVAGEPPFASFRSGHVAGIESTLPCPSPTGSGPIGVRLDRVCFRYPGAATLALDDVSLDAPAGSLVAVTGPVGSGKSALARTLLGLYPLESGQVLLDGCAAAELAPGARLSRIGYLPQDAYLFSGSIRDNVAVFSNDRHADRPAAASPPSDASAVERATALAALDRDLRTLPAGLDTEIGELGIRVSGGQRQRIALARAVASRPGTAPGLLVLDDPFSAVDLDTEAAMLSGLRDAFGPAVPWEERRTIVLLSHRLAAFPKADRVVVLDRGRIVEEGTHQVLMDADRLYARIFRAQERADRRAAPAEVPG